MNEAIVLDDHLVDQSQFVDVNWDFRVVDRFEDGDDGGVDDGVGVGEGDEEET